MCPCGGRVDVDVEEPGPVGGMAQRQAGLLLPTHAGRPPRGLTRVEVAARLHPPVQPLVHVQDRPAPADDDRRAGDVRGVGVEVERVPGAHRARSGCAPGPRPHGRRPGSCRGDGAADLGHQSPRPAIARRLGARSRRTRCIPTTPPGRTSTMAGARPPTGRRAHKMGENPLPRPPAARHGGDWAACGGPPRQGGASDEPDPAPRAHRRRPRRHELECPRHLRADHLGAGRAGVPRLLRQWTRTRSYWVAALVASVLFFASPARPRARARRRGPAQRDRRAIDHLVALRRRRPARRRGAEPGCRLPHRRGGTGDQPGPRRASSGSSKRSPPRPASTAWPSGVLGVAVASSTCCWPSSTSSRLRRSTAAASCVPALWEWNHDRDRSAILAARAGRGFGFLLVATGIFMFFVPGLRPLRPVAGGARLVPRERRPRPRSAGPRSARRRAASSVGEVMSPPAPAVLGDVTVSAMLAHTTPWYRAEVVPVVDPAGMLTGLLSVERLAALPGRGPRHHPGRGPGRPDRHGARRPGDRPHGRRPGALGARRRAGSPGPRRRRAAPRRGHPRPTSSVPPSGRITAARRADPVTWPAGDEDGSSCEPCGAGGAAHRPLPTAPRRARLPLRGDPEVRQRPGGGQGRARRLLRPVRPLPLAPASSPPSSGGCCTTTRTSRSRSSSPHWPTSR